MRSMKDCKSSVFCDLRPWQSVLLLILLDESLYGQFDDPLEIHIYLDSISYQLLPVLWEQHLNFVTIQYGACMLGLPQHNCDLFGK